MGSVWDGRVNGLIGFECEQMGLGPASGFVALLKWSLFGVFSQNIFSVAGDDDDPDVNTSTIEPTLNVSLGGGWSVETSEMTLACDRDVDEFISLPLGAKLLKLTQLSGVPTQVQRSYEHNFNDNRVGPEDTIGLTVKMQVPK